MQEEITSYIAIMMLSPAQLTDAALLIEVKRLAQCERETTATLVAHLVEVEVRDLYRSEGCSSMFKYCTEVLGFAEDAAVMRIQAARAVREHPEILADLASGALHLSALRLLAPYLSSQNGRGLLDVSRHKSKREVEHLVRERFPLPDVPASVRKLPSSASGQAGIEQSPSKAVLEVSADTAAPGAAAVLPVMRPQQQQRAVAPLAADRFKIQFTASAEMHDKLRQAQDLLRHQVPNGDLSRVFELALNALIERLEKQRFAATDRPRAIRGAAPGSRVIPAEVRRTVWMRDEGRCAFIATHGRRCSEAGFLEFHHLVPFAQGGEATITNISLRCRSHNQYEAKLEFGPFDPSVVREAHASWGVVVREASAV